MLLRSPPSLLRSLWLFALFLVSSSQAFPSQPGTCNSPQPFGNAHLRNGDFVGGTELSTAGIELLIEGKAVTPGVTFIVERFVDSEIELRTNPGGTSFRGYLIKIAKEGVDTTEYLISNNANVRDDLDTCLDLNAGSLSHTNNNQKTSVKGILRAEEVIDNLRLEVTVAIQNDDVSEWYQSVYVIAAPEVYAMCFPGDAVAQVKDRGSVAMKDLKLGDLVLTDAHDKYEPIYSFGHYNTKASAEFLQLKTASETVLELSKDHMVFVAGNRAVPASAVQVGDTLVMGSGQLEAVESIATIVRKGVMAPFTPSGSIIVNGVKASSFVAFQGSETFMIGSKISTGITYQWLAHTFELPHRVWCYHLGACEEEQYTADGISTWVGIPHKIFVWYVNQQAPLLVMAGLSIPFLLAMTCLWGIGLVTAPPFLTVAVLAVANRFFSIRIQKTNPM